MELVSDPVEAARVFRVIDAAKHLSPNDLRKFSGPDLALVTAALHKGMNQSESAVAHNILTHDQVMITLLKLGDQQGLDKLKQYIAEAGDSTMDRASIWVEEAAQPETIPILAEYLFVEEPVDWKNHANEPYWMSACDLIREVLLESGEIDVEVKHWITALDEVPVFGGADEYRQIFRDWYRQNENLFREKKYSAIQPGRMLKSPTKWPSDETETNAALSTAADAPKPAPQTQTPAPKASAPARTFPYPWIALALAALALLWLVLRQRQTERTTRTKGS